MNGRLPHRSEYEQIYRFQQVGSRHRHMVRAFSRDAVRLDRARYIEWSALFFLSPCVWRRGGHFKLEIQAKGEIPKTMKPLLLTLLLSTVSLAQGPFWTIYELETIAEKRVAFRSLTHEEKAEAWRMNFAWAAGRLELTDVQRNYITRLSGALPTLTNKQLKAFQDEAVLLFPTGRDTLFNIGPYTPDNVFTQKLPSEIVMSLDACPCSVGSKFNSACFGPTTCTPASGLCQTSPDGCGFLYLHQCNGFCTVDLTGGCG